MTASNSPAKYLQGFTVTYVGFVEKSHAQQPYAKLSTTTGWWPAFGAGVYNGWLPGTNFLLVDLLAWRILMF